MAGRRQEKRLVAAQLKRLLPGIHGDGNGLYLHVKDSGSRSWILRTTVRSKRREVGLGGLSITSLAEAREESAALRARARKGEDILEIRRTQKRNIPTFEQAARGFHEIISHSFDSDQHARNWLRSLERYVFPSIGSKTVDAIDSADVLGAIGPIWNTIPDTARRTLRRIKAIFEYCQAAGHRNVLVDNLTVPMTNPCDGLKTSLPNSRNSEKHHGALDYRELSHFVEDMRATHSSLFVKLAFEFLILTAARTSEVLMARWDEIDLDEKTWTVPGERMKMKQLHRVPLSSRAGEILDLAKQFGNAGELVFPSKPDRPLSNMSLAMVLRRMDLDSITVHGFRSTFKTWAEERTKFDSLVIEAALAHQVRGIERHYLRTTFFDKRRALMDTWARLATAAPAKKVVRMRR